MEFPSGEGVVRGRGVQQLAFAAVAPVETEVVEPRRVRPLPRPVPAAVKTLRDGRHVPVVDKLDAVDEEVLHVGPEEPRGRGREVTGAHGV